MFDQIKKINEGLLRKFPKGNDPFQMVTRLAEEVGELASEVNHFENSGIKREKHGEPNKAKLAGEAKNVISNVLQIIEHYQAEKELKNSIEKSIKKLQDNKWI